MSASKFLKKSADRFAVVIRQGLFPAVLLLLAFPVVQQQTGLIPEAPLKGYFHQEPLPPLKYFTWHRWFSGDFQQLFTSRLNENTGFRPSLIRVRNQYDWSCFGITHARGFLKGKEGYLFEEDYIHEYTGRYFIGERPADQKLYRLKVVSDSLKARGIPLIFIIEPGKASYFPEFVPDTFDISRRTTSNYDVFTRLATRYELNFIDLNKYFMAMKDTSVYPLFPRYGMHWSLYGVHLAADSLRRCIGVLTGARMPGFTPSAYKFSEHPIGTDYDIGELLNLMFPLPATPGLYPEVPFDSIPDGNLPALIVADSYYINMVETYGKKMFGHQDYWYYNGSPYPHQNETPPVSVDKTGLREKLLQYKVILLMVSEINLHCGFWGFADEAWQAFHPETPDSKLEQIENSIRIDREWFRFMVAQAGKSKKPLDEVIRANAEYVFNNTFASLENKTLADTLQNIRINLSFNPEWVQRMKQVAWQRNIPTDSAMLADARRIYQQSGKKP